MDERRSRDVVFGAAQEKRKAFGVGYLYYGQTFMVSTPNTVMY